MYNYENAKTSRGIFVIVNKHHSYNKQNNYNTNFNTNPSAHDVHLHLVPPVLYTLV